jgi:hypothetical protein
VVLVIVIEKPGRTDYDDEGEDEDDVAISRTGAWCPVTQIQ